MNNIINNAYKIYNEIENSNISLIKKNPKLRVQKIYLRNKYIDLMHHGVLLGLYTEEPTIIKIKIGNYMTIELKLEGSKVNFIHKNYVFPLFLLTHNTFCLKQKHSKSKIYAIYYDINEDLENYILRKNDNETCIHMDNFCFYGGIGGYYDDKSHNYLICDNHIKSYDEWNKNKLYLPKVIYI